MRAGGKGNLQNVKRQTTTTIPAGFEPVSVFTAEQAVQTIYEINIPVPDHKNKVLRPSLSTRIAALNAATKLKIWRRPLMSVCVNESVIPTVSRTRVK